MRRRAKALPRITLAWLKQQGACLSARRTFRKVFGESATVTRRNIRRAAAARMPLYWLPGELDLSAKARLAFENGCCCRYCASRPAELRAIADRIADALGLR